MPEASVPRLSDIIFPSASASIPRQLSDIKRCTLSISNRIRSIHEDATFVQQVARSLSLPVLANERAGSWYCPTELKHGSVVFKSTDGHFGNWSFSLRRLNLTLLELLGRHGGAIVVDSTRQGKHLPDAFTKTIPIWVAVFNRLLFPDAPATHAYSFVPELTSQSEVAQVEERLPRFLDALRTLDLDVAQLRASVRQPIACEWISRSLHRRSDLNPQRASGRNVVYLCMASRYQRAGTEASYTGYVQGAGDDHETWAKNLTPTALWANFDRVLDASDAELADFIEAMTSPVESAAVPLFHSAPVVASGKLNVGKLAKEYPSLSHAEHLIICSSAMDESLLQDLSKVTHLRCGAGKVGSRDLRKQLPKLVDVFESKRPSKIYIACSSGNDLSVGVALALDCLYFDSKGNVLAADRKADIDKTLLRQRLNAITSIYPSIHLSSTTLKTISAFLMGKP